ncbi:MAG: chemotaxis protein CheW [Bacillota bacterium]
MPDGEQQVVVFQLGDEFYGVDIGLVRGVEALSSITRIPRTPPYIRGVINLRGRVIPVVDLKLRLGLPAQAAADSKIAVIEADGQTVGVMVDGVSEVAAISPEDVDPPSAVSGGVDVEYILGVARRGDRLITLLDLTRALARTDRADAAVIR